MKCIIPLAAIFLISSNVLAMEVYPTNSNNHELISEESNRLSGTLDDIFEMLPENDHCYFCVKPYEPEHPKDFDCRTLEERDLEIIDYDLRGKPYEPEHPKDFDCRFSSSHVILVVEENQLREKKFSIEADQNEAIKFYKETIISAFKNPKEIIVQDP